MPSANKISINLMTDHIAETVRFYTDLLGFELTMSVPEEAPFNWVQLSSGKAELMFQTRESMASEVAEFEDAKIGGSFGLYIEVSGLQEMHDKLSGLHLAVTSVEEKFYGMNECHIKDPNGYFLTLAEKAK